MGGRGQRDWTRPGGGGAGLKVNKFEQVQLVVKYGPPVSKQTDTSENITFKQLRWRAVKN